MKFKDLKIGNILGESQYYTVDKIVGDKVQLTPDGEKSIVVTKEYVEEYLLSADHYDTTVKVTKTELGNIFISSGRVPLTVAFYKQAVKKTKKAYNKELQEEAEKVKKEFMDRGVIALEEALANPVLEYIPGELRVMRGRHSGEIVESTGRMNFVDMEARGGDGNFVLKQADPRTIQYLIVDNAKYILK